MAGNSSHRKRCCDECQRTSPRWRERQVQRKQAYEKYCPLPSPFLTIGIWGWKTKGMRTRANINPLVIRSRPRGHSGELGKLQQKEIQGTDLTRRTQY